MAGFYPDAPGPRMAYHRDGSQVVYVNGAGAITALTSAQALEMNDEDEVEVQLGAGQVAVIFPELRDLVGYFLTWFWFNGSMGISNLQWSANTTTGADGTWTTISASPTTSGSAASIPAYRSAVVALSVTGAKGVRFTITGSAVRMSIYAWHLYGKPTAGQVRFLMVTDTAGVEVTGAYFDFADDPRGTTEDKTFKLKNGHATLTANSVVVSFGVGTDKSVSHADDYTFSTDGTTFAATVNIGALAPGASSGTLHVRRTTPSTATLGLETGWIQAVAGSWS